MKLLTILGARPQFVKAATVSRVINENTGIKELLIHTGQHYDQDMSDVFFQELDIPPPARNLGIGSAGHGVQTGRMLSEIESVLMRERPDGVLVYGDTNSTLAGALAAVKLHIPVAHVEAGLRSFNRRMPEEINRVLTDHASDLLFAPTDTAIKNLAREGIAENKVHLVGDVMYDAALYFGRMAEERSTILKDLGLQEKAYVLATVHRAENTDDPARLETILGALAEMARRVAVVLPIHPRTRAILSRNPLLNSLASKLRLIDPVGYLDMTMLERNAAVITTDSGGVQKEAYFQRVPCVTLRDETEWTELVETGWNTLAGASSADRIVTALEKALSGAEGQNVSLYGTGDAAKQIVQILLAHFS